MSQAGKKVKMISPGQIRLLWMLANNLGWSRDDIHDFCKVKSLKELSAREAKDIADAMIREADKLGIHFEDRRGKNKKQFKEWNRLFFNLGAVVQNINRPSNDQMNKITILSMRVFNKNPKRFLGWLQKYHRISCIAYNWQAQSIIEGLKSMERQLKEKRNNERRESSAGD